MVSAPFFNFDFVMIFFLAVLILDLLALFTLRHAVRDPMATALWAGLIIFAPIAGAVSFFITKPTDRAG
jgi:hypothetical protein